MRRPLVASAVFGCSCDETVGGLLDGVGEVEELGGLDSGIWALLMFEGEGKACENKTFRDP